MQSEAEGEAGDVPAEKSGWVAHEQKRRGKAAKTRPPIVWDEVAAASIVADEQQAAETKRFQVLLDRLKGCGGKSEQENKDLAETVDNLAERLGWISFTMVTS